LRKGEREKRKEKKKWREGQMRRKVALQLLAKTPEQLCCSRLFLFDFFSLLDSEVLELPRVLLVDLLLEEEVAAVERRPVGVLAVHVAEVVGADLHDAGVLDLLGLDNT
jgi:c-di-GMP-related signal transduction protein